MMTSDTPAQSMPDMTSQREMTEERGRILVVDDNRTNRIKLSLSLQQQGHTVSLAENGQQALDMLRAQPFDAVLLDIIMPEMDGHQALERIKSNPELRDIPVIVISALDEIDSAVRCIEIGAEDYLPKPFNPVLLRARLNASLQKKKLRDLEKMYLQQDQMLRQNEKLATLGRLSAGVAHELNNPAAAAKRSAAQLEIAFSKLQQTYLKFGGLTLSERQRELLSSLDQLAQERAKQPVYIDSLTRSDRETDLETWLTVNGVANTWEIVPTLVNLGYGISDLAVLASSFPPSGLPVVIDLLTCSSLIYALVEEIRQGAGHISEIVKALKTYTYLDQAPIQTVDIHDGLDNTLIMLRSKLQPGVVVQRDYAPDMPRIEAYGSELNQVWTNLIDNAVDAMKGNGTITIRTRRDNGWAIVEIEDSGPGIPEALQSKVFDPFFTTKPPGQGTGLGLSISHSIVVQKHKGRIDLHSQPGRTRFEVRLPLHLPKDEA